MKTIFTIFVVIILCGCGTSKYVGKPVNNKADESITLPVEALAQGTYIMQFHPMPFTEPVSALPLAIVIVLGFVLFLAIICTLYEYIKKIKFKSILFVLTLILCGCGNPYPKPNDTPYARGYKDAVERLVRDYNIPFDQRKFHEGYTLDSLKYVSE